ncbi:nectin-3-like isoform X2 [Lethenteron reissneri]|uniref:nectin-3-like isoform X2 n=1 Tax=Lethenteron reissneri TaxID=7753 RepID=UPI002AB6F693|nr:nectin-3-like isoform X2 [Lethenteron reissneri]
MKGPFRLLVLYGLVTLGTSQVEVDRFVNGSRGKEVILRCLYTGPQTSWTITWQKGNGESSVRIAFASPDGYTIDNDTNFYGRLNFTNFASELKDGSIRIEDLRLEDEGDFNCGFGTQNNAGATISLTVHAPPNVFLELNPSQLVDGMGLVTVATCIAQEGKPAASITWSGLNQGSSNETTEVKPDGMVTVKSRYWMEPKYESHGRTLTCWVEHPAFEFPMNLSTTLDIYFPPNVSLELNPSQLVEGMGLVTVATCVAREGHPAASITWSGLDQGSSNETTESEPDSTVTVRSEYRMEPTHESQGRTLTCRVEHTALEPPLVELSTTLDIHYKPSVSISGYDGDWYVDKEGASLTCKADANPNITHYLWDRRDSSLPHGTVVNGNSLSFERPLVESDSGSFSCWANNSVGWGEAVVLITIRPGTTTAATTTATTTTSTATTTTSTTPIAATTPGVADNGGGVDTGIIAVAVIVPLLVLAAVAGSVFFFCKKKGTQATKKRKHGQDAPVGSAHQPQQQHQQQDEHHQYEYIDGKFPSHNLESQQPPPGSAEFDNAHAEITSNWNNDRERLNENNLNSTQSNPQNQEGVHYQPLKPTTEKTYDKLNHPTYENV